MALALGMRKQWFVRTTSQCLMHLVCISNQTIDPFDFFKKNAAMQATKKETAVLVQPAQLPSKNDGPFSTQHYYSFHFGGRTKNCCQGFGSVDRLGSNPFGTSDKGLFATQRYSRLVSAPIAEGSAVSWFDPASSITSDDKCSIASGRELIVLLSINNVCSCVSWPISEGMLVRALLCSSRCVRVCSWPMAGVSVTMALYWASRRCNEVHSTQSWSGSSVSLFECSSMSTHAAAARWSSNTASGTAVRFCRPRASTVATASAAAAPPPPAASRRSRQNPSSSSRFITIGRGGEGRSHLLCERSGSSVCLPYKVRACSQNTHLSKTHTLQNKLKKCPDGNQP
eukprot:m.261844 g.261844  ORF g.261844 m.261844 type:complete len:341 (+) comp19225_c1_seq35:3446-4468(+)